MQIINFAPRGFCLFDVSTAKKTIDTLISKRQKPLETRLANNLSRTLVYLLLTIFYISVPVQISWIPKLQHFSYRWNHRLGNHLSKLVNVAVISAWWDGFLPGKYVTELYHLYGIALFLDSGRTCSPFVKIAHALTVTLSKSNGKSENLIISLDSRKCIRTY